MDAKTLREAFPLALCAAFLWVSPSHADGRHGVGDGAVLPVAFSAQRNSARFCKVSEKSVEIARRLDRSGYYSRMSRAYKGYPHLRSKRSLPKVAATGRVGAVNAENRRRFSTRVHEAARTHRLDPKLIDAVIVVESAYDAGAVSPKGAIGLMQLMPGTAKRFDVSDPFDPSANIRGGARYLRWLMNRFDEDVKLVLAAYNAGENAVEKYGNKVPPYEETQTYVARVLQLYRGAN